MRKALASLVTLLVLGGLGSIVVLACERQGAPSATAETLHVQRGDIFEVSLGPNPSADYSWQVESDPAYVLSLGQRYEPAPSDLVGVGGQEVFLFQALNEGDTQVRIQFTYHRPGETDILESKTYAITIE